MNHIYILGSGAVGLPLAACLSMTRHTVVAVRTSRDDIPPGSELGITLNLGVSKSACRVKVRTVSLAQLSQLDGIVVVATKSYANVAIAKALREKQARGPVVILQNGLGVEAPFLEELPQTTIGRGVLYVTSQFSSSKQESKASQVELDFRAIQPSRLGLIRGSAEELHQVVQTLSTPTFPFAVDHDIQREVWKKAIVNVVFNSICPLLEVDNGFFHRDAGGLALACELVRECVNLTRRLGLRIGEMELVEQIKRISQGSTQWISTLQDLKKGRRTEIDSLNLEIARVAASLDPIEPVTRVEWLGKMILAKSQTQLAFSS